MTDYTKLADLAAQAVWNATLEDDPEQGTWEDAHDSIKAVARTDMEEFAHVLYPVFAAHALRDAADYVQTEWPPAAGAEIVDYLRGAANDAEARP